MSSRMAYIDSKLSQSHSEDVSIFYSVAPLNGDLLIYSSSLLFGRMTQISWMIQNILTSSRVSRFLIDDRCMQQIKTSRYEI